MKLIEGLIVSTVLLSLTACGKKTEESHSRPIDSNAAASATQPPPVTREVPYKVAALEELDKVKKTLPFKFKSWSGLKGGLYCRPESNETPGDRGYKKNWPIDALLAFHFSERLVTLEPSNIMIGLDPGRPDSPYFFFNPSYNSPDDGTLNLKFKDMPMNLENDPGMKKWKAGFSDNLRLEPLEIVSAEMEDGENKVIKKTLKITITDLGKPSEPPTVVTCVNKEETIAWQKQKERIELARQEKEGKEAEKEWANATPEERTIMSMEAKGGNCPTIAQHLRMHLQNARRTGDWSGYQTTLGQASQYGC